MKVARPLVDRHYVQIISPSLFLKSLNILYLPVVTKQVLREHEIRWKVTVIAIVVLCSLTAGPWEQSLSLTLLPAVCALVVGYNIRKFIL